MFTVGLADDQQLVRAGFSMVLGSQDDIEVVWEANNGREAVMLAQRQPVDVILMDIQMPVVCDEGDCGAAAAGPGGGAHPHRGVDHV